MKITTLEDRLHIVELARTGHTAPQIAELTGWSLPCERLGDLPPLVAYPLKQ